MARVDKLLLKNKKTGAAETIVQRDLEMEDWGFTFLVDTELEAYKAAYQYRNNPHGVMIRYTPTFDMWMITVYNARAKEIGCDGAK